MRRFLTFVSFFIIPSTSFSQTLPASPGSATPTATAPATPLTLPQLLDLAHRANPTLLSAAQHLAGVRAQEITAGLRANPIGIVGGQLFTASADDPNPYFYQAGVQRLFERGSKRQLRLDNARSTTTLTAFQLDDQRRQMDLAIRQAFSRMLYAQQGVAISRENLEGYRKTVALMKVRLDAGDMDQTDFDRVELQLSGFESDLDNAELALRQGSIVLQTLVGIATPTDAFAIAGILDPPRITATLNDLRSAALANRPDLKAAQTQVDVNAAAVKLAIANGTADPTIESEYERSGHVNTFGANINIPLRLFDRNQGEKERTRFELESSRLALTAAQNQVVSDVDSAWAAYLAAQSQSVRYRSKYLSEAAHVRDNLEFSYRNGNSTLLDYLSALSDYRLVNLAALNAQLQLLLSIEQLSYASHTEINP
ncbi:MAG TPA: TolC family protein [Acidobacteriaceae bacterium]|nr:TolC family protein [Acidobacteriaceae bacterium]